MSDPTSSGLGPGPDDAEDLDVDAAEAPGTIDDDPATDDSVSDVLPEGLEEPDPPAGLP